jgi:Ca2+-binding RTX toxin-like protein
MAGNKRTVSGPFRDDVDPPGTTDGTGYRIGDGYTLTAGHVVLEWDRNRPHPQIIDGSNTIALDFNGYRSAYLARVTQLIATTPPGNNIPANGSIEAGLVGSDSVLISGGGNIGSGADGLVVFLTPGDLISPTGVLSGASIYRDANVTGLVSGSITAASGGRLTFSQHSLPGDSGGAYLLRFGGRDYVIGTQSAQQGHYNSAGVFVPTGDAFGTYFSYGDWTAINSAIASGTGDITDNDPTNMVVGSVSGDNVTGSFRADIILGLGGNDELRDGDTLGTGQYARDQLFGGAGDDKLYAGSGKDLLHGGDHRLSASVSALDDDGIDEAHYEAHTAGIKLKLLAADAAPLWSHDYTANAVWVEELGGTKVNDSLVSIEKVIGTGATDTIQVDGLRAALVGGSDGKGGLVEVDLGANPAGDDAGDHIDATKMKEAIKIDLSSGRVELKGSAAVGFTVKNAERITGGEGDDELTGDDKANIIKGGKGKDTIKGGGEADKIDGGEGDDNLQGGGEADKIDGGEGDDILTGGAGADELRGGEGADTIDAEKDDDGGDSLYGGAGGDTFKTNNGDVINDIGAGDSVTLQGLRLVGGERKLPPRDPCTTPTQEDNDDEIESDTYKGRDGTTYVYNKESSTLQVTGPGGTITILDWTNGEGGIRLRNERPPVEQAECNRDPLIFDLNNDKSVVAELYDVSVYFDVDNDGIQERVAWALPEDGFLALDRNGDGRITNGSELFGTGTVLARANGTVTVGTSGFADLALLDSNHDAVVNASDDAYSALRIWQDLNSDGITDQGELKTLSELGIASISLRTRTSDDLDCGCDGTRVVSMSDATKIDGSKIGVYDAFLAVDNYDTIHTNLPEIPDDIAGLPFLLGSGDVPDLHSAMVRDPLLRDMVEALSSLGAEDSAEIALHVERILLRWTGADQTAVDGRGAYINGQWLNAIEMLYGSDFRQNGTIPNPRPDAASGIASAWRGLVDLTTAQLIGQTEFGKQLLPGLSFDAGAFFSLEAGTSLETLLASIAATAPASIAERIAHWHVGLATLAAAAPEFGMSVSQIDAAAGAWLQAAGISMSAGDVRGMIVGGASGLVSGTHVFRGNDGVDLLYSVADEAVLSGGSGGDTYLLREGQHVVIRDSQGVDELWLPDFAAADVQVSFFAYDGTYTLIVRSSDGATSATATGAYNGGALNLALERIRFADGSILQVGESVAQNSVPTDQTDIIAAHPAEGTLLDGKGGADFLLGYAGDDSFLVGPGLGGDQVIERGGSTGDVLLIGASRADTSFEYSSDSSGRDLIIRFAGSPDVVVLRGQRLAESFVVETFRFADGEQLSAADVEAILLAGTPGSDTLVGGYRDDVMDGKAGDDLLAGGAGTDTYVLSVGGGHDVVRDEGLSWVSLTGSLTLADLTFHRGGDRMADLVIETGDGTASLRVEGQMMESRLAGLRFADGSEMGWDLILAYVDPAGGTEIRGTSQDDNQQGTAGDDVHLPGKGNDYTYDPAGDDTYRFNAGDGRDTFYDGAGNDVLALGRGIALADIHWWRDTSDLVMTIGADEVRLSNFYYSASSRIEAVRFHDGTTFDLTSLASRTVGTAGNDYLFDLSEYPNRYPYYGSVDFHPGAGDDVIRGSLSHDTIYLDAGWGNDTILDDGKQLYSHPGISVVFGAGLSPDLLRGRREGDDLILYFEGRSDELRLVDRYANPETSPYFSYFTFSDGTFMYGSTIDRVVLAPTSGDDDIRYGSIIDNVEYNIRDGGPGNDILRGQGGSLYPFAVGYGHDIIINRSGTGVIRFDGLNMADVDFSRSANNPLDLIATIRATGETLTILSHRDYSGVRERNDPNLEFTFADGTLTTGQVIKQIVDGEIAAGVRTFVSPGERINFTLSAADETILAGYDGVKLTIGANSGRDTLVPLDGEQIDSIYFKMADIGPSQLSAVLYYDIQSDVPGWRIAIGSGPTSLIIFDDLASMYDWHGPLSSWDIEVSFGASTQRMYGNHLAALVTGSLGSGLAAALGVEQIEAIFGTPQDDVLYGSSGAEVLAGGEGDDTYLFGPATGHDIVAESLYAIDWGWEGEDVIKVLEWNRRDVTFSWGEHLNGQIVMRGPGNVASITFSSYDLDEWLGAVHWVQFADGSRMSTEEIVATLLASTSAADEVVQGDWDSNELDGRGGNDLLAGGLEEDVYVFGRDYGHDTILELAKYNDGYWDANHVRFLDGIGPEDLIFTRGGDDFQDLIVTIKGDSGSLTIRNQFQDWRPVHEFRFADGSVLTWQQVHDLAAGLDLSGDNVIETGDQGGVLDGGAGFDELRGGTGDDVYLIGRGNDEDRVIDSGGASDVIRFEDGVGMADVVFSRSPDDPGDLMIEVTGIERLSMTVTGQLDDLSARIEFFEFADGTRLSARDVERLILDDETTSSNDVVSGFAGSDTIDGGAGNDTIAGGGGDDRINGGAGRDIAVFSGARQNYEILVEGDRATVRDLRSGGGDGVDILTGVEDLRFLGDGPGASLFSLKPANRAPAAAGDSVAASEDQLLVLAPSALLGNDSDADGDALRIARVFDASAGQAWVGLDGSVRYRPPADFTGVATFSYEIVDPSGARSTAQVSVVVGNLNDSPDFAGASVTLLEDGTTTPFAATDRDGDILTYSIVEAPAHGTLVVDPASGAYAYVPARNYAGPDSFVIAADDGKGGTATARFDLAVEAVNDAPVAPDMNFTLASGAEIEGRIAAIDPDDAMLSYGVVSAPAAGLLTLDPRTGAFTYAAPGGFVGVQTAQIVVADPSGESVTVTLSFGVEESASRPPVVSAPLADRHVPEDVTIVLAVPAGTFTHPDGDSLALRATLQNGGALPSWLSFDGQAFAGTPPLDFNGLLELRVYASDGLEEVHSDFRLIVDPANDGPVHSGALAQLTATEDLPFDLAIDTSGFSDPDGDALAFSVETASGAPLPNWLVFSNGRLSGTAPADFNGDIDLRLVASDETSAATGAFTLSVLPVNDAPALRSPVADIASPEDQPIEFTLPAGSFADVDGDALALSATLANGAPLPAWLSFADGRFTGRPPANENGPLDIRVVASDGRSSTSDVFRLSLTPVNDSPVTTGAPANVTVAEDQPIDFSLQAGLFVDPDGDGLTLSANLASGQTLPSWLTFAGGRFTGAPPANFNGALNIVVSGSDGTAAATAGFTLTVTPLNDAPQAANDETFLVVGGDRLTILAVSLLENDVDPDGDTLTIVGAVGGARGAVSINGLGDIVYTPEFGFMGSDSFQYTVSDGTATATATVFVTVTNPFDQWQQGTSGRDNLRGNMSSANRIFAAEGDDHVRGGKLDDQLAGGSGDDHLLGLEGGDALYGMAGDDQLNGGPGQDTAYFSGFATTYVLTTADGALHVKDMDPVGNGDDGRDSLVGIEHLSFRGGVTVSVAAPIILDLDGDGIELKTASESHARFDMDGDDRPDETSWFGSGDAMLFFDSDGNGTVSGPSEFGFADALPDARSDLAGLAAFDTNEDGRISASDAAYGSFAVWQDLDENGIVGPGEVMTLAQAGVTVIHLSGTPVAGQSPMGGPAVLNIGRFETTTGQGVLADVAFTYFTGRSAKGFDDWLEMGPAAFRDDVEPIGPAAFLRHVADRIIGFPILEPIDHSVLW